MPETLPDFFYSFDSAEVLADKLAEKVAGRLDAAITLKGKASLVVSGGSTPLPLFTKLSRQHVDWQRVFITLADERWVDTSDSSSNEHAVRVHLLQNKAAQAKFIGLKNTSLTAVSGELETHAALEAMPRPFDMVILGMGDDGHTASLFPSAERLPEAVDMQSEKSCIAITPPEVPFERMSMTLRTLLDTNEIILHITGEKKRATLAMALDKDDPNNMPIRYIIHQEITPVSIYWAP